MGYTEKHELWKKRVKDRKLLRELLEMNEDQINSAFYKELEFGTAGIRGIMGAGSGRINIYTVRKITQGVAIYMQNHGYKKVAISYDSRINSEIFAREVAAVMTSAGMTAYITPTLMPTPYLSYAVRRLATDIGIMITASHNPSEYNGYKVYDESGCQIREEAAKEIAEYISQVDAFRVKTHSFDYFLKRGAVNYVPDEVTSDYMAEIDSVCTGKRAELRVVFTPLCGTGYRLVPQMLSKLGCEVILVPKQSEPDGKFPTCKSPNPEKKEALKNGIKLLKTENADLLIATDPDADRIGVAFMDGDKPTILSGNEMGVLMCDYLLSNYSGAKKPLVVRTLVSTDLVDKIALEHSAEIKAVPTGFKYIGEIINNLNHSGEAGRYLLGFEESQGYLIGTHVRDKDAVVGAKLMAIIAADLKRVGKTLGDRLKELYDKYGYYAHKQFSYRFEGSAGETRMKELLEVLRGQPLTEIAGKKVTLVTDYAVGNDDLPKLNMIRYDFAGGNVIVRPSGTEPLIKIYACSHLTPRQNDKILQQINVQFGEIFA